MFTLNLTATVTEDRRLVIELPPESPIGVAHITVEFQPTLTAEELLALHEGADTLYIEMAGGRATPEPFGIPDRMDFRGSGDE